jgi:hypothetical protein
MWALLPPDAESVIMAVARERSPRLAQLDGIDRLLIAYQLIFTKFRYYYELHEDLTSEQLREKGERWLNNGAPESEADVVYYDEELVCLIAGLRAYVEARL